MSRFVEARGVIVLCAAIGAIGAWLCGCAAAKGPDAALLAEAAAHQAELTACVARGKEAKSYRVYEVCANTVDIRYGLAFTDGGPR